MAYHAKLSEGERSVVKIMGNNWNRLAFECIKWSNILNNPSSTDADEGRKQGWLDSNQRPSGLLQRSLLVLNQTTSGALNRRSTNWATPLVAHSEEQGK